jgi:hypothetical protein
MNESMKRIFFFKNLLKNSFFPGFSKHIQPTTEQNLQEIEADDLLLKRKKFEYDFDYFFI